MRRPTTSNTTVYPHLERFTPEDHALVRRLATNATDPDRFKTSLLASRALCALHLCGRPEGDGLAVMVMSIGDTPDGYFTPNAIERAEIALGVGKIMQGPRWAVMSAEAVERAAAVRRRRAEIIAATKALRDEFDGLSKTCPHLNVTHHPRGTAEDQPWDECEDCKENWGG